MKRRVSLLVVLALFVLYMPLGHAVSEPSYFSMTPMEFVKSFKGLSRNKRAILNWADDVIPLGKGF